MMSDPVIDHLFDVLSNPISVTCKKTRMQICHLCEKTECCDNQNPLVDRIKNLEKEVDYGTKTLRELAEKIDSMSKEELKTIIEEADEKFKTIQQNRKI
jgi:hypothetical protein